jgi:carbon monoxide dehydrogenase subunit G
MPLDLVVQEAEEGQRLHVVGNGRDPALGSGVRVDIHVELSPDGTGTSLQLVVDAIVSGKIAGLGAGLFKRKFDDITGQFGQRLKASIESASETAIPS